MRIAVVQQFAGTDVEANVEKGLRAVERAAEAGAGLVVFAELALTPFWPQRPAEGDPSELAEPVPGPTTEVFAAAARRHGVVIVLNLYERDGDRCYDTSPVLDADGALLGRTRMVHIADLPGFYEKGYYAPGDTGAPVYDTAVARLGVAICYDRHFPEYMRAMGVGGAEIVVVPQAGAVGEWPEGLFEAEMRTAAFQNGYFTALANRVGKEPELEFAGRSFVCGPDGRMLAQAPGGEEHVLVTDLDLAEVERSPARWLFLDDRRPELYGDWLT